MSQLPPNVEELFYAALEFDGSDARAMFLEGACVDAQVRRRVERLLEADARSDGFLDVPTEAPTLLDSLAALDEPGCLIGPYRLIERIGEGGMGTVYLAEQTRPVRRLVALKIVKPGMASTAVIARFEAERQALAIMDHPHIATVLDAGTTDADRPYFVMELVQGVPITRYCDDARLSLRERLELLIPVCQAVQHAHQKGVIHRDLKPSNVLVGLYDGRPVPKVIDFGVAKATGPRLGDLTLQTGLGTLIGTPEYMSPEQAQLDNLDIDTRADIYSLGVLLYELLTGTTPLDAQRLKDSAILEVLRLVREEDPPRPSTRLCTIEELPDVASRRGVEPRRLTSLVRGELDWIVMKALEKDRTRRYETATSLADDLRRYLDDEPVQASPPSAIYRLSKFARRHRTFLAAAALTGLFLAIVAAVAIDAALDRASLRAGASEALAEADRWGNLGRRAEELEAVKRAEALLVGGRGDLRLGAVRRRREELEFLRRLEGVRLEMAAVRDDTFDEAEGDRLYGETFRASGIDPETLTPSAFAARLPQGSMRLEIVAALDDWARIRRRKKGAADTTWKTLLAASRAADPNPTNDRLRAAWLALDTKTLRQIQKSATFDQLDAAGIALLHWVVFDGNAWNILREAQQRRPDDFWLNHDLAVHYQNSRPPRLDDAIAYYRAALALRPESPGVLLNLGQAFSQANRLDEAITCYRRSLELSPNYGPAFNSLGNALIKRGSIEEGIAAYREAARVRPSESMSRSNLAKALYENGRGSEAVPIAREAARLGPNDASAQHNLGTVLSGTGGDVEEAELAFLAALRARPNDASSYNGLGSLYANRRHDYAAAIPWYRLAIQRDPGYSVAHANLGKCLQAIGDHRGAVAASREAVRLDPGDAMHHADLAVALGHSGRLDEAIAAARRAIAQNPTVPSAHHTLGVALGLKGQNDEALSMLRQAVALTPNNSEARYSLGTELLRRKSWAEAADQFEAVVRAAPGYAEAHCNLGHARREQGRPDLALPSLRRGHALGSRMPGWNYPSDRWVAECEALVRESRSTSTGSAPATQKDLK